MMAAERTRYSLENAKQDIISFFTNDAHWAYQYGSKATACTKDSVFYKRQIQVTFEDTCPHDVTGKAVNELIESNFLKSQPIPFGTNMHAVFVWRRQGEGQRYKATAIKEQARIISKFSEDEINDGAGKYAEVLFQHLFKTNQFKIVGRDTNSYKGRVWSKSDKNLDFIIEKDGVSYGVEIKNTFDYMPQDEFEEKLDMCNFLGILPLFPLRCPSDQQFTMMQDTDGLALKFKTRIFPPGNQKLVTEIWNHFRLPVFIWDEIPQRIENVFLNYHKRILKE